MTTVRVLLALTVALCLTACVNPPPYRDVAHTVPEPPAGQARIFFYGDTLAWKGFRFSHEWHPTVLIDGQPIPTPNQREVVFFVDRPPGTYEVSVDNDVRDTDVAPPDDYPGRTLTLEVQPDRSYFVKMRRHGDDNIFWLGRQQHYLSLKEVQQVLGEVEIERFGYPAPDASSS